MTYRCPGDINFQSQIPFLYQMGPFKLYISRCTNLLNIIIELQYALILFYTFYMLYILDKLPLNQDVTF